VLFLLPWMIARKRSALRIDRGDWGYFLVLGLFGVASVQATYYYSIAKLGVGLAILLQYLAPSLIVLAHWFRGGRIGARTGIAVVAAVAGTALLVGGVSGAAQGASPLDWAIGFASALAFAFYVVYSKRGLARYPAETVLLYTFLLAALVWALVTPPWRIVAQGYPATLWVLFLVLGLASTLIPFALFYAGLRRLSPTEAGIMATLEPVVAMLAAALFLGESLRSLQWLGAALVLGASILASRQVPESVTARAERA
jgi:drug/metabolite transporter (DMT)-like permease